MNLRASATIISLPELDDMLMHLAEREPVTVESCEEETVHRSDIEHFLSDVTPSDREMLILLSGYGIPSDYDGVIPPTSESVGIYIGMKERGKPLTARAIRKRCSAIQRKNHDLL